MYRSLQSAYIPYHILTPLKFILNIKKKIFLKPIIFQVYITNITQITVFPDASAATWTSFRQPEDGGSIFLRNDGTNNT